MRILRGFSLVLFAFCFALPCLAEKPGVKVAGSASKELKRSAHRLRIPVDQLKDAREALQEATDLLEAMEPCPVEQIPQLMQLWEQLHRSKAKEVAESFMATLRAQAADCANLACYQQATSAAMMLVQLRNDPEKMLGALKTWPEPKESFGAAGVDYLKSVKSQARQQVMYGLASTDPEKAIELLNESADEGKYNYTASGQIAQSMMYAGKKDEALQLIDETINRFDQQTADEGTIREYENFVRSAMNFDSERSTKALRQLITAMTGSKQANSVPCSARIESEDHSIDLTCAEARLLNLLRSYPMKPSLTSGALDAMPALKSKLDAFGGIDGLFFGYGSPQVHLNYGAPGSKSSGDLAAVQNPRPKQVNIGSLIQKLKGKAESDPSLVRGSLKDLEISQLINLASSAAYQDPDLSEIALKMAQKRLPEMESLPARASMLQSLVNAQRNVEGEVDPELLREGFAIADRMREESSPKPGGTAGRVVSGVSGSAIIYTVSASSATDQLEAFLVAEISRDDFDAALDYVHTINDEKFRLTCLLRVIQAQMQANL